MCTHIAVVDPNTTPTRLSVMTYCSVCVLSPENDVDITAKGMAARTKTHVTIVRKENNAAYFQMDRHQMGIP